MTRTARQQPHDAEAEASVLAATLHSRAALDAVAVVLRPDQFFVPECALVWSVELELYAMGRPVDVVTVGALLNQRDQLDQVGGAAALDRLASDPPDARNVDAYVAIVRAKWKQRALIATLQQALAEAHGDVGDVDEWVDRVEEQIHMVSTDKVDDGPTPTLFTTLTEVYRDLQDEEQDPGVRTGLADLDAQLGPMLPGQTIVLGAHSGIGKSALGSQIAASVARERVMLRGDDQRMHEVTQAVLIFSCEMRRHEIAQRMLFAEAMVNSRKVVHKKWITPVEWERIAAASTRVGMRNVFFDDRAGITPLQIRSRARRVVTEARRSGFELRCLVIDYLQLIDGSRGGRVQHERREREIAAVSVALKQLATELSIPVIILAQLNDDARRDKRRPRKEDLRESKQIAMDADKVLLIHNPSAALRSATVRSARDSMTNRDVEYVELLVDKNRGGDQGKAIVRFWPSFTLFESADPEEIERVLELDREERAPVRSGGRGQGYEAR